MKNCDKKLSRAMIELGYDGPIAGEFRETHYIGYGGETEVAEVTKIMRLDDAAYFLCDKYDIHIYVDTDWRSPNKWVGNLKLLRGGCQDPLKYGEYDTSVEALEATVREAVRKVQLFYKKN